MSEDFRARIHQLLQQDRVSGSTFAFVGLGRVCPDCLTQPLDESPPIVDGAVSHRCARCAGVWLERGSAETVGPGLVAQPTGAEPAPVPKPEPPDPALAVSVPEPLTLEPPVPPVEVPAPPPVLPVEAPIPTPPVEAPLVVEDADEALQVLFDGNRRFAEGRPIGPRRDLFRLQQLSAAQSPFAVVVTCSDSRVPPEILFDTGIGDVFVLRTAGHVLAATGLGSVLYAVEHLGVPLVLVLGHTGCGAVKAALTGTSADSYMYPIVRAIQSAVELATRSPGSHWDNAVRVHTQRTVRRLRDIIASQLPKAVAERTRVVGAVFDLETGRVQQLEDLSPSAVGADVDAQDDRKEVTEHREPPVRKADSIGGPPEPAARDAEAPEAIGAPGAPGEARYPRWCPKCRKGFGEDVSFCTTCGVLLVQPTFAVKCLRCGKANIIGSERCYACGADLHPAWLQEGRPRPRPPVVRRPAGETQGCGTSVLAMTAVFAAVWGLMWLLSASHP